MTETLTIDRKTAIEIVAWLDAAGGIHRHITGEAGGPLEEHFDVKAWEFKEQLLGPSPEGDDEYETDPTVVEINARSCEIVADALDTNAPAPLYRKYAQEMREQGTVRVPFPYALRARVLQAD